MKYGIMTFHNIPNFGAVLQAYALCRVLREKGIECEIIDYYCDGIVQKELVFHGDQNPIKNFVKRNVVWPKQRRRISACQSFLREHDMVSHMIYHQDNIQDAQQVYDGFISGSDMIWELPFTKGDMNYFLAFADDTKQKLSYGSSVRSKWGESQDTIIGLLKKYQHIGVRETDVKQRLTQSGVISTLVCDPTMLISQEEWGKMTNICPEEDYVLVYFPDTCSMEAAKCYAKLHRKKILVIQDFKVRLGDYRTIYLYTPLEWLSYVRGADAVFSSSYHATLFSLYFHRNFWVSGKWNKTTTVLQKLGLMDRHITDDSDYQAKIDYTKVDPIIRAFRRESLDFLERAVEAQ